MSFIPVCSLRAVRYSGLIPLIVCSLLGAPAGAGEPSFPLDGAVEMSHAELAAARGGFVTPSGFEIGVGVDVQSLVGQALSGSEAASQTALNPSATFSTQLSQLISAGQVSTVINTVNPNVQSLVQNTLNNATIQQIRQINLTISNYSQIQSLVGATATQLAQQVSFGQVNTLR